VSTATLGSLLEGWRPNRLFADAQGSVSEARTGLLSRCAEQLREHGVAAGSPVHAFFVPGRVEVLGKHTDYAGGRSLLAAVERGLCVLVAPRSDPMISVVDAAHGDRIRFRLSPELRVDQGWASYPMTVARRIARDYPDPLEGADLAFASDLPPAAGMSSSSALVVAVFLALAQVNRLAEREEYRLRIGGPEELAQYLAAVESGADYRGFGGDAGVGTRGGSQDHTAILCSRADRLVQYAFGPVRLERSVGMPAGLSFAVAVSGVRAEKAGGARQQYNAAAEQMARAVRIWRDATGRADETLGQALDNDPTSADRLLRIFRQMPRPDAEVDALRARVEQFVEESTVIVPAAGNALERGDLDELGRLVDRSQRLAESSLRNQVPETIALARAACELGAHAASAFGAGFGGSVWALVEAGSADDFLHRWRAGYLASFPGCAAASSFFTTRPGPPALRLA
jgi:galactokinase